MVHTGADKKHGPTGMDRASPGVGSVSQEIGSAPSGTDKGSAETLVAFTGTRCARAGMDSVSAGMVFSHSDIDMLSTGMHFSHSDADRLSTDMHFPDSEQDIVLTEMRFPKPESDNVSAGPHYASLEMVFSCPEVLFAHTENGLFVAGMRCSRL